MGKDADPKDFSTGEHSKIVEELQQTIKRGMELDFFHESLEQRGTSQIEELPQTTKREMKLDSLFMKCFSIETIQNKRKTAANNQERNETRHLVPERLEHGGISLNNRRTITNNQ